MLLAQGRGLGAPHCVKAPACARLQGSSMQNALPPFPVPNALRSWHKTVYWHMCPLVLV